MVVKKYEFTGETKVVYGVTLHRIRALRDFGLVKKGEHGGWLEHESNLSHEGNCWVRTEARVFGDARVADEALVFGEAWVSGSAKVYGNARVHDNAHVWGDTQVFGDARVYGKATVSDEARVADDAWVSGEARVLGFAQVSGNARVYDSAVIRGTALIDSHTAAFWAARVGVAFGTLTVTKAQGGGLLATRGCFTGSVEEFLAKSKAEHDEKTHLEYQLLMQVARMRILGKMPT